MGGCIIVKWIWGPWDALDWEKDDMAEKQDGDKERQGSSRSRLTRESWYSGRLVKKYKSYCLLMWCNQVLTKSKAGQERARSEPSSSWSHRWKAGQLTTQTRTARSLASSEDSGWVCQLIRCGADRERRSMMVEGLGTRLAGIGVPREPTETTRDRQA